LEVKRMNRAQMLDIVCARAKASHTAAIRVALLRQDDDSPEMVELREALNKFVAAVADFQMS